VTGNIVDITPAMRHKASRYAREKQPTSFPRYDEGPEEQVKRLTIGKLGELVVAEFLRRNKIPFEDLDNFSVVNDRFYRDSGDFLLFPQSDREMKTDVKTTCATEMLTIPIQQILNQPMDLYIGVKLDRKWTQATIYGFISGQEMWERMQTQIPLNELTDIQVLAETGTVVSDPENLEM
jgi:hypothetical protein